MKNNIFQKQNNFNDKKRTSGVTNNTFSHINSDDICVLQEALSGFV